MALLAWTGRRHGLGIDAADAHLGRTRIAVGILKKDGDLVAEVRNPREKAIGLVC